MFYKTVLMLHNGTNLGGFVMATEVSNYEVSDAKTWQRIKEQVNKVEYGNVNITIHDGKIVQVETSTKIRF